ncbi:hypothetical protein [Roseicella aerolata]|uniref:hypothetical protein n=1 Tax=Roseicella aerolata TaxID=2883479 RepID=UPI0038D02BB2
MPPDQPSCVAGLAELEQDLARRFAGAEGPRPEQLFLAGTDEALRAVIAPGAGAKADELSMPGKRSSAWKAGDMCWLPWPWGLGGSSGEDGTSTLVIVHSASAGFTLRTAPAEASRSWPHPG